VALERILDQPRAVALLRRGLAQGRVAQAYAFVGPRGAGRTTTALDFAAALLCAEGGCGACRNCRLVLSRQHPDLHVIVPTPPPSARRPRAEGDEADEPEKPDKDRKAKGPLAIRIDDIREIGRLAWLRPAVATRKVFILDDAERMTGVTPEAFLKILEEPPGDTVFVLVLPRARAVPATVISRCQLVRFEPRADPAAAAARAEAWALLGAVRAEGMTPFFRRTDRFDRERGEALVDAYWLLCRDLLVAQAGAPAERLVNGEHAEEIRRESLDWTAEEILDTIERCRRAREALAVNVAPRLTLETLLSRLALRAA
jgi:DNA polymerase-3 subunit delta'